MSSIHDLHHHFKQKERHIMKERDDNISGFFGLCVFAFIHLARFWSCIKRRYRYSWKVCSHSFYRYYSVNIKRFVAFLIVLMLPQFMFLYFVIFQLKIHNTTIILEISAGDLFTKNYCLLELFFLRTTICRGLWLIACLHDNMINLWLTSDMG